MAATTGLSKGTDSMLELQLYLTAPSQTDFSRPSAIDDSPFRRGNP